MNNNEINFATRLDKKSVEKILRNNFHTLRLVSEYAFFNKDGNADLYIEYIHKSIATRKRLYNAIELASIISYTSNKLLKLFQSILTGNHGNLLKLSSLDYLIFNKTLIEKRIYVKLNKIAQLNTKSTLVQLQASLNLLAIDWEANLQMQNIRLLFKKRFDPAYIYRLISCIEEFRFKKKVQQLLLIEMKNLLHSNHVINHGQRLDFNRALARLSRQSTRTSNS